ncbi:MAG: hypothetical protein ACFBSE_02970 [Prochloraceae cyanobacterium]
MKLLDSTFLWFFAFTIIFLLSLDFWRWDKETSFAIFHLPDWIFYFIGLQLLLSLVLLVFSLKFWQTSSKK